MKYIKKLENYLDLNVGDYILVNSDWFKDRKNRKCKIVEITQLPEGYQTIMSNNNPLWVHDDMIFRKLTDKEIEQYNIEIDSNKYNL